MDEPHGRVRLWFFVTEIRLDPKIRQRLGQRPATQHPDLAITVLARPARALNDISEGLEVPIEIRKARGRLRLIPDNRRTRLHELRDELEHI